MSILQILGRKCTLAASRAAPPPGVSRWACADGTDRQTDGRMPLCFPLDVVSITSNYRKRKYLRTWCRTVNKLIYNSRSDILVNSQQRSLSAPSPQHAPPHATTAESMTTVSNVYNTWPSPSQTATIISQISVSAATYPRTHNRIFKLHRTPSVFRLLTSLLKSAFELNTPGRVIVKC